MRILTLGAAWFFVALGFIGAFLPVLPTTPFLLLAATLFARSSPRFERWLLEHPRYGQPLIDWRREGAISRNAKIASVSVMAVSYGMMWLFGPSGIWLKLLIGVVLLASAAFVITRPLPGR